MTNYYEELCFEFPLTDEQSDWLLGLHEAINKLAEEGWEGESIDLNLDEIKKDIDNFEEYQEELIEYGGFYGDLWVGVDLENTEDGVIFSHDENANEEHAGWLIQKTMQRFNIARAFSFEWSFTASRQMLDAYGGGAATVTKDWIKWFIPGWQATLAVQRHEQGFLRYYYNRLRLNKRRLIPRKARQWLFVSTN
jgi:hypothetical protein